MQERAQERGSASQRQGDNVMQKKMKAELKVTQKSLKVS